MQRIGRYRIQQKLGEGGMGVVYKAHDRDHHRAVALKLLHPHLRADPERQARFLREAQVCERLDHPGIARLLEHGEVDLRDQGRTLFMAMEFVPGRDLQQRGAFEDFDQATIVDVGLQIADALEAAHAQGIVHRDLKPHNVKMSRDGTVKILDFGLAKMLEPPGGFEPGGAPAFESRVGVVLGTAPYSAPEQLFGHPADARSDLFSLGVILFQLITHSLPYRSTTALELLDELKQPVPSTASLRPNVAPGLGRVVDRLLSPRPSERYQSAAEVKRDLKAVLAEEAEALGRFLGIAPPPASSPLPLVRRTFVKRPGLWLLLLAFLLASLVALGWLLW